jgi:membrane carboxypeptidase/penicillin-binding protein PbpC
VNRPLLRLRRYLLVIPTKLRQIVCAQRLALHLSKRESLSLHLNRAHKSAA